MHLLMPSLLPLMLILMLLPLSCRSASLTYQVDTQASNAWFEVAYWGRGSVRGKLSLQAGRVEIDTITRNGRGEINVDMNSVQTGREFLNKFIKSSQVFDSASFPVMSFQPSQFEYSNERLAWCEGELMLHGVSKLIRLEVRRFSCQDNPAQAGDKQEDGINLGKHYCYGEFAAKILRSQFGMDNFSLLVDDEVGIVVNLALQKVAP